MIASKSLLGRATANMWANPLAGAALTFGAGSGLFAGTYSMITTPGGAGDKADAAAGSAIGYGVGGVAALWAGGMGLATAGAFRAGLDGYSGGLASSIAYGVTRGSINTASTAARSTGNYFRGIGQEFRSGGWRKTLSRPMISGGLGAALGSFIGSRVSDDPNQGAAVGAGVGAGAGIAAGRIYKASTTWSRWGVGRRGGTLLAASAVLGGALKVMSGRDPESVDVAQAEDYRAPGSGIKDRMSRIGANGSLVFGLR